MMRIAAFLGLLLVAHVAAAAPPTGLRGTVWIPPATPVCRIGASCDAPARHVALRFAGRHIYTATTDDEGRYRIALAPGRYRVTTRTRGRLSPSAVVVWRGVEARRDFALDIGIR